MTDTTVRIAMWSGPRNISTAMMRAWENRPDTFVTDEPFYAFYLQQTGLDHPAREAVIASQPTDWREVAQQCAASAASGCNVHYQKHMTQHMLPEIDLDWLAGLTNVFLIRSPEAVVASYAKARPDLTAADLGFEQQHRLFTHVTREIDTRPLVISAASVLKNPTRALTAICHKAGIDFKPSMLAWPAGKRASDGVWAPHWYANVEKSTGFGPPVDREIVLDQKQHTIAERCRSYYNAMLEHCLPVE